MKLTVTTEELRELLKVPPEVMKRLQDAETNQAIASSDLQHQVNLLMKENERLKQGTNHPSHLKAIADAVEFDRSRIISALRQLALDSSGQPKEWFWQAVNVVRAEERK